jgi:nicotinate-nucleotide pyrophosphorylase (carboxylating)
VDALRDLVRLALEEDRAFDDITTRSTVPSGARGRARLVAKEPCVVAGLDAFVATFELCAERLGVAPLDIAVDHPDGSHVSSGVTVARVDGELRAILPAERTALNFIQRLSGVATLTARFVELAAGVELRDTRKTTPGMRALEKAAVRSGGGTNHRADLAAAILIKDNHIVAAGGLAEAVAGARATATWVEVECDTLDQVREAVEAGADEILLDNMTPEGLRAAVEMVAGRARTEASGGVTLETIAEIAKTGVDAVSTGAPTHSARAIDLSLDVEVAR